MASISSPGLGSGLDINGIVSKLMAVESQPLTLLATREASYQAKISAYGTLKSALSSLQSAADTLAKTDTFTGLSVSSSDTKVLTAAASDSPTAANYNINVTSIAKYHAVRSDGNYTATTDTFNTGTLSISVGGGTAVDVAIDGSNNTLAGIRDAINDADAGVTASIVNDGTYQRLLLTSKTLGSDGAINVAVSDDGSGGTFALTALASASLIETQAADDAQLTINGLTITRSSNTIADAVDGVTFTLLTTGSSTVKVATNTAATVAAFDTFVKAFNDAKKQISSISSYNSEAKQGAILTGDSTVRSIQSRLNQLLYSNVSGITGSLATLSDIGITLQKNGTLSLDTSKLTAALNDPAKDVQSLMTQTTSGNTGIAVRFSDAIKVMTESNGLIDSRTTGINASIKGLQKQGETLQQRLQDIERRYRAQFTALDTLIASLNQTSQYLSQQLANLPKITSN
jgi:flagellar hook-associated protein 2